MTRAYNAAEVRRITDVTQRCLDYWEDRGIISPSIQKARGKGTERRYSFDDLVRITVVNRLRATGLSLQKIRAGLAKLRKRTADEDVLLHEVLESDGKTLFRRVSADKLEDALANGQLVLSIIRVGRIRQGMTCSQETATSVKARQDLHL
jgi:DNA-binding transcriptional MerR regulator